MGNVVKEAWTDANLKDTKLKLRIGVDGWVALQAIMFNATDIIDHACWRRSIAWPSRRACPISCSSGE
jgi:hypothetical protein|tara:strand:- start:1310 stop:1513 length:204 start_codon:yes stop_codon:yes gene_type:complete